MFGGRIFFIHHHHFLRLPILSTQTPRRWLKAGRVQIPVSKTSPRDHMRRIYDAAVLPILPPPPPYGKNYNNDCPPISFDSEGKANRPPTPAYFQCSKAAMRETKRDCSKELSPRQLATRNHLRQHLQAAVVLIVCHEHPTDPRTQNYELMDMAASGVAFTRLQDAKVMRSLFDRSSCSLASLVPFFEDDDVASFTSLMFVKSYSADEDDGRRDIVSGKVRDGEYLPAALSFAKRIPWIVPLAVVYENRILTIVEAENVAAMLKNPLRVRAETTSLLNAPILETERLLNERSRELANSLQARAEQLSSAENKEKEENIVEEVKIEEGGNDKK